MNKPVRSFAEYDSTIRWGEIPDYMRAGIERWIDRGTAPGGFLEAVLKNDLREAVCFADTGNFLMLRDYVRFLHSYAPPVSHGSVANFRAWAASGGLQGRAQRMAAE